MKIFKKAVYSAEEILDLFGLVDDQKAEVRKHLFKGQKMLPMGHYIDPDSRRNCFYCFFKTGNSFSRSQRRFCSISLQASPNFPIPLDTCFPGTLDENGVSEIQFRRVAPWRDCFEVYSVFFKGYEVPKVALYDPEFMGQMIKMFQDSISMSAQGNSPDFGERHDELDVSLRELENLKKMGERFKLSSEAGVSSLERRVADLAFFTLG